MSEYIINTKIGTVKDYYLRHFVQRLGYNFLDLSNFPVNYWVFIDNLEEQPEDPDTNCHSDKMQY